MANAIRLLMMLMAMLQGGLFYPATLEVTKVEKGVVTMTDQRGHDYYIEEAEVWDVGDWASAIMFSNGTLFDKTDDEIVTVEYVRR